MNQKVEVTYTEVADNKERMQKIADILADGVYAYLKLNGLLKSPNNEVADILPKKHDSASLFR